MPGQVTHPLQVGAHPQAGDDDAQVGGHRLLPGQQSDRPLLELDLQGVDLLVRGDDALGQREVGVEQGDGGPVDRGADQSGHLDHLVGERVELLVELLAHANPLRFGRLVRQVPAPGVGSHRARAS